MLKDENEKRALMVVFWWYKGWKGYDLTFPPSYAGVKRKGLTIAVITHPSPAPCHPWARKVLFFEEKQGLFLTRGSCCHRDPRPSNANVFHWKTKHCLPRMTQPAE
jgi:hypothetical protein